MGWDGETGKEKREEKVKGWGEGKQDERRRGRKRKRGRRREETREEERGGEKGGRWGVQEDFIFPVLSIIKLKLRGCGSLWEGPTFSSVGLWVLELSSISVLLFCPPFS